MLKGEIFSAAISPLPLAMQPRLLFSSPGTTTLHHPLTWLGNAPRAFAKVAFQCGGGLREARSFSRGRASSCTRRSPSWQLPQGVQVWFPHDLPAQGCARSCGLVLRDQRSSRGALLHYGLPPEQPARPCRQRTGPCLCGHWNDLLRRRAAPFLFSVERQGVVAELLFSAKPRNRRVR